MRPTRGQWEGQGNEKRTDVKIAERLIEGLWLRLQLLEKLLEAIVFVRRGFGD